METLTETSRLWNRILDDLRTKIDDNKIFDAFLGDSFLHTYADGAMLIAVNSRLAASVLSKQYAPLIQGSVKEAIGTNVHITFQDADTLRKTAMAKVETKPEFFATSVVNPSLTFDNFIVGPCNREAKQAALLIASNPGKNYNPLFIYSNSGLGKTHLLYAIYNYLKVKSPNRRALYCTTDDFMVEFIKYVTGEKEQEKLKNFITSHDVLLIDDIQGIGGKTQTELFFFQVFTKMYNLGKHIIITSDKHPSELKGFAERLTTRFAMGLTVTIDPPDIPTCVNILKAKIESSPLDVNSFDPAVLEFIAMKFSKSVRNIDEALNRIVFYTTSYKPTKYINMDIAIEALQSLIDVKEAKRRLDERRIISVVADYYSLTPAQLIGTSRAGNIILARHLAMYLVRLILDLPFARIGLVFGNKDHSTVMSGVRKVEKELKTNAALQVVVSEIRKELKP